MNSFEIQFCIRALKVHDEASGYEPENTYSISLNIWLRVLSIMLVDTPQITWHGGEAGKNAPILSLDTHPLVISQEQNGDAPTIQKRLARYVLATAGTDAEVRLWIIRQPSDQEEMSLKHSEVSGCLQSFVVSLGGHQRGVNVVRFSPDGLSLASASDGGTVVIWSVNDLHAWINLSSDRETRKVILQGATDDIYDLTWSPDCKYIVCGSIDRRAHVWEISTKRSIATFDDHANYVQGTAWDPLSMFIATQSSDRSCRMYLLDQVAPDGHPGVSHKSQGFTARCCEVIKSCVVSTAEVCDKPVCGFLAENGEAESRIGVASQSPSKCTGDSEDKNEGAGITRNCTRSDTTRRGVVESGAIPVKSLDLRADGDTGVPIAARERASCIPRKAEYKKAKVGEGPASAALNSKDHSRPHQRRNLFVDETVTSFFRRLTWSPDGAFVITPTAQYWDSLTRTTKFCTYLFTRGQFSKPSICLPGLNKPSVAIRCNPRLFTLKVEPGDEANEAMCDLPYRAVFAVVSLDAVVVYDTQHSYPLTVATGLHYSGLTDACWSADGMSLFVSSTDGYISKFHFKSGELGSIIPDESVPLQTRRLHPVIYGLEIGPTTGNEPSNSGQQNDSSSAVGADTEERGFEHPRDMRERDELGSILPIGPGREASSTRPKKKITPTFVTPLSGRSSSPKPDTGLTPCMGTAIVRDSPSATEGLQSDRRKRRITPTLVRDAQQAKMVDAESVSRRPGVSLESAPLCLDGKESGTSRDDQTLRASKKKRVAPTLVSGLVT